MRYIILPLFLLSAFPLFGMQSRSVDLEKKMEAVVKIHESLSDQLDTLRILSWSSLSEHTHITMYHALEKKLQTYYEMADTLIKLNNPKIKNAIHDIHFMDHAHIATATFLNAYQPGQAKRALLFMSLCSISEGARLARENLRKEYIKPWLQPEDVLKEEIKEQKDTEMAQVLEQATLPSIAPEQPRSECNYSIRANYANEFKRPADFSKKNEDVYIKKNKIPKSIIPYLRYL